MEVAPLSWISFAPLPLKPVSSATHRAPWQAPIWLSLERGLIKLDKREKKETQKETHKKNPQKPKQTKTK